MKDSCAPKSPLGTVAAKEVPQPMLAKSDTVSLSPATHHMQRRTLLTVLLGLAALLFISYSLQAAPLVANETVKLPSGHLVRILSNSPGEYSKGVMALMIRYETKLSVDERKALSQEVD